MTHPDSRSRPAAADPVALLRHLVSTPSVNPALSPEGSAEGAVASLAAGWLREWGFSVRLDEAAPGRSIPGSRHRYVMPQYDIKIGPKLT